MTDPLERLELELSSLRPRPPAAELIERIGAAVENAAPSPWPDRCLAAAMLSGALAACVIVAMFVAQPSVSAPAQTAVAAGPQSSQIKAYSQLLTRAGDQWSGALK